MFNQIRAESPPPDGAAGTVPVAFAVRGLETVRGAGRLVALAIVTIEVAGVELLLQGVQVVRGHAGSLQVQAPVFRHPASGRWTPAVVLPPALRDALGAEILAMMQGEGQE